MQRRWCAAAIAGSVPGLFCFANQPVRRLQWSAFRFATMLSLAPRHARRREVRRNADNTRIPGDDAWSAPSERDARFATTSGTRSDQEQSWNDQDYRPA